jgi:iron(III) transport system permease protein
MVVAVIFFQRLFCWDFCFPFIMMLYWTTLVFTDVLSPAFWILLRNSFVLASLAAITVVVFAVFIAFTVRTYPKRL